MPLEINGLEAECKPLRDPHRWIARHFDRVGPPDPYKYLDEWISDIVRAGKSRARKRGLSYTIDVDDLVNLAKRQGYACAVSGIPFDRERRRYTGRRRHPFSPSIDRIDNSKGYEDGNVRLVCLIVNLARNNFDDAALIQMARAIVARHGAQDAQSPALQA